jgi:hypothetical protein
LTTQTAPPPQTFSEFWPYYLQAHLNVNCRRLHYLGSTGSLVCLFMLVTTAQPGWIAAGLLIGYGCAWAGHLFVEGNRPAAFKHPLWSLAGDWKMFVLGLSGRLAPHLEVARKTPALPATLLARRES